MITPATGIPSSRLDDVVWTRLGIPLGGTDGQNPQSHPD